MKENVELGMKALKDLLDEYDAVNNRFADEMTDEEMDALLNRQGELQDAIDAADAWDLDRKIEIAMDALRVPLFDDDVSKLSGGERRRVALCQLLLSQPDLLLHEEPTNHKEAQTVPWLEPHLESYPGTCFCHT